MPVDDSGYCAPTRQRMIRAEVLAFSHVRFGPDSGHERCPFPTHCGLYDERKQTPISRPESRTETVRRKSIALCQSNNQPSSFLQTLTAPVFSLCRLRTESHQTPVGIKLVAMLYDRPGGSCRPRETLVPSRVQGLFAFSVAIAVTATPVR